jgi:hypothetical protein
MRKNNCETVRQELDELMLDDACSAVALEHLRECSTCREFQQSQTKLRQMVGSLGTVAAPADFDFRLRARLASDSSNTAFHLQSAYSLFARRGFAIAAVLLFIATGAVLVRNVVNRPDRVEVTKTNPPAVNKPQPPPQAASLPEKSTIKEVIAKAPENRIRPERPSHTGIRPKRIVAEDFSSQRAEIISGTSAAVFPIDASLESFQVSLDDGRGNARTISLPTIRFGSQRMLPNGNPLAAKGVW